MLNLKVQNEKVIRFGLIDLTFIWPLDFELWFSTLGFFEGDLHPIFRLPEDFRI